jgi:predicted O-linked N-acetylglucosamine transferase (SPINDLY family)
VLTRKGASFAARVSASLLHTLGLDELATECPADYEALAVALARDSQRLAGFRARLAEGRKASVLFDPARLACAIEAAYTQILADRLNG